MRGCDTFHSRDIKVFSEEGEITIHRKVYGNWSTGKRLVCYQKHYHILNWTPEHKYYIDITRKVGTTQ